MVNRIGSAMLFFASTVDTSLALPPGATREILASSTQRSQLQEGFYDPAGFPPEMNFSDGPFPLAAAYTGPSPAPMSRASRAPARASCWWATAISSTSRSSAPCPQHQPGA
ncbi:MAG: hypothetical protein R2834_22915 [Rhodothermales bacterium]